MVLFTCSCHRQKIVKATREQKTAKKPNAKHRENKAQRNQNQAQERNNDTLNFCVRCALFILNYSLH